MNDELHDIPDPSPLLPGVHVPWYAWAVLATLFIGAIILLVSLLRGSKPAPPASISSIYEESRKHLEQLRQAIDQRPLSEIATEASLSVRRYLAACLGEPALFETHEEFILRDDALAQLPAGIREKVNPFLKNLAELKYSPSQIDPDNAEIILKKSLNALQGIESTRAREIPTNS